MSTSTNNSIDFRRNRIFWGITYLLTFGLWMWAMDLESVSDFIFGGVISVFAAALTFVFVGIGLLILLIPVRIGINIVRDILGKNKATPPASTDCAPKTGDQTGTGDGGCCGDDSGK